MSGAPMAYRAGLFGRLVSAAGPAWTAYTQHEFLRQLAAGTLAADSFRHYLIQDYLFLVQFARAWALAAYKSDTVEEIRAAVAAVGGIIDTEMALHVSFCRQWGIAEKAMQETPRAPATLAYTSFVLERGNAGDLLDLQVALAPCIVGYGEIGAGLSPAAPANPYRAWIEMYGGADYQALALRAIATLEQSGQARGGAARLARLAQTFSEATRLEARFWQMALDLES